MAPSRDDPRDVSGPLVTSGRRLHEIALHPTAEDAVAMNVQVVSATPERPHSPRMRRDDPAGATPVTSVPTRAAKPTIDDAPMMA